MSIPSPAAIPASAPGIKLFKVGTLTYTQPQLIQLFFTLCWNDFTLMLLENVNSFGKNLQFEHGASYAQIAVFGMFGTGFNILINPIFSVWSDRTRTRWGRRRPFLLCIAPPLAITVAAIPYMPELAKPMDHIAFFHAIFHWFSTPISPWYLNHIWPLHLVQDLFPVIPSVLMLGSCMVLFGIFNSMILALFSYLYWDVVPQVVLGRWTATVAVMSNAAVLIWNLFLIRFAVNHMKTLCVVLSLLCVVIYVVSVLFVKEGEYPKPDKRTKGAMLAPIRAFFVECYSDPFFLWIFSAFFIAGLANASNDYKGFYLRYDLHADYAVQGWINGIPYSIPVVLGYFVGMFADKLHPIRMYVPTYCAWGTVSFLSYFFIHSQMTFLIWSSITQLAVFANGVTYGALLPQIYPRAKFGQFCAANQLLGSIGGLLVPVPVGILFDHLKNNRFAYLFSACFLFAAAVLFTKVRRNFDQRHGHVPVPHAG